MNDNPTKRVLVIWPDGAETEHQLDAYEQLTPGSCVELWRGRGGGGLIRKVEAEVTQVRGPVIWVQLPKSEPEPELPPECYGW